MPTVHALTDEQMNMVRELAHIREEIRALEVAEEAVKSDITDALAGAEVGEYNGQPAVRVSTVWRDRFDLKRFRSVPGYTDIVSAYTTTSPVTSVRIVSYGSNGVTGEDS